MKEQIIELRHCFSMLASMASQVKVDQRTRQLINDRIDKNREVLDHLTAEQGKPPRKKKLSATSQKILDEVRLSPELTVREVSDEEIEQWAYSVIPVANEGCIENDIDHAKRSLLIKAAKWMRDKMNSLKS